MKINFLSICKCFCDLSALQMVCLQLKDILVWTYVPGNSYFEPISMVCVLVCGDQL